jgi:hypothetical protein
MSTLLSVQAPVGALVRRVEDVRGVPNPVRARGEVREPDSSFCLACRDVLDEVRQRMEVRGYRWE